MLETKIEELTAAVKALTEVLLNPVPVPQVVALEQPQHLWSEEKAQAEADRQMAQSPVKIEDLPAEESTPAVTYDDVKNIVIAVSKVSKAKAVAALGRFGVKTAKELTEGQWADFVGYMMKVQAGGADPEASE